MVAVSPPPGLSTASKERRRVALAVSASARFDSLEYLLAQVMASLHSNYDSRLCRLETLTVMSPSVDEVLDEMLRKSKPKHREPVEGVLMTLKHLELDAEWSPDRSDTVSQPDQELVLRRRRERYRRAVRSGGEHWY